MESLCIWAHNLKDEYRNRNVSEMKSKPSQIIITVRGEWQDVWKGTKDLNCGLTFLLQWEQLITLSSLDTMLYSCLKEYVWGVFYRNFLQIEIL